MPAAQHTEGQWTGQAQTKVPLQIPGISSALSPTDTVVSSIAYITCICELFEI